MEIIYNPIFLEHETGHHPENPGRLRHLQGVAPTPLDQLRGGEAALALGHGASYVERVARLSQQGLPLAPDTPTSQGTYRVACAAVAAAVRAAERQGVAVVRPPGHHAAPDDGHGFCLFNNIGIAALQQAAAGRRVFILDIDLHHGDGTEAMVYGHPRLAFFSIHQQGIFPGTGHGNRPGCRNLALPYGTDDETYQRAFTEQVMPALQDFAPDLVAVSAGFDGHILDRDLLGPGIGFSLTAATYRCIGRALAPYATFAVLEGGYNPDSIRDGLQALCEISLPPAARGDDEPPAVKRRPTRERNLREQ